MFYIQGSAYFKTKWLNLVKELRIEIQDDVLTNFIFKYSHTKSH